MTQWYRQRCLICRQRLPATKFGHGKHGNALTTGAFKRGVCRCPCPFTSAEPRDTQVMSNEQIPSPPKEDGGIQAKSDQNKGNQGVILAISRRASNTSPGYCLARLFFSIVTSFTFPDNSRSRKLPLFPTASGRSGIKHPKGRCTVIPNGRLLRRHLFRFPRPPNNLFRKCPGRNAPRRIHWFSSASSAPPR